MCVIGGSRAFFIHPSHGCGDNSSRQPVIKAGGCFCGVYGLNMLIGVLGEGTRRAGGVVQGCCGVCAAAAVLVMFD